MCRKHRLVVLTVLAFSLVGGRKALAERRIACLSIAQCKQPDSMNVLLPPGTGDVVLDANFGLVAKEEPAGWQYSCDEVFGGRIPYRTRIAADGRTFVPAADGLSFSADGCTWTKATGALQGQAVYDVGFDPQAPQRVWIVGGSPRLVALSSDGGRSFQTKYTLPEDIFMIRVAVAPSDSKVVYTFGFSGKRVPLVMALSKDGGETWTLNTDLSTGVATSNQIAEFLGISPDDAKTTFFLVTNANGDEVWRSTDEGRTLVKVLTLDDAQQWPQGGFAFGANGQTVYVAGFDALEAGGRPPATLYVSHDGGTTWTRKPSPATGPRFRCLGYRAGTLYACGGDQLSRDLFLVGTSTDEGGSWSPVLRLSDIRGARTCAASTCALTVDWLCNLFGSCPEGVTRPDAGVRPDAAPGTLDAGPTVTKPSRSGCDFGAGGTQGGGHHFLPVAVALGLLHWRRRQRPMNARMSASSSSERVSRE